jgi:hypothetical protein
MQALKDAGFICKRRARQSHYVMQRPLTETQQTSPPIIVPNPIDDIRLAKRIAKVAGVNI